MMQGARFICLSAVLLRAAAREESYKPCLPQDRPKPQSFLAQKSRWSLPGLGVMGQAMKQYSLAMQDSSVADTDSAFRKAAFNTIYESGYWKDGQKGMNEKDDSSGGGEWSRVIEDKLCDVINQKVDELVAKDASKPVKILDLASGDFHWMKACLVKMAQRHTENQVNYQGLDIADSITKKLNANPETFPTQKNLLIEKFHSADAGNTAQVLQFLGDKQFDIVVCVHALMHNSHKSVKNILQTINKIPGAQLFITNNYHAANQAAGNLPLNSDIASGMMRPLNLQMAPFNEIETVKSVECSTPVPTREDQETFKVYKLH